ncbi:hypothetical protein MtrunA17_Chr5g0425311 [Medicago truncatula]|uniref:Uncharacterized protein n=1 Tax=Medicago truncatula TaxID=3880 RepID=A0A396HXD4_MEDTR|nr:hypothetical protein MtrunA17_Chr5g0425311 [Medicago truncatula]
MPFLCFRRRLTNDEIRIRNDKLQQKIDKLNAQRQQQETDPCDERIKDPIAENKEEDISQGFPTKQVEASSH